MPLIAGRGTGHAASAQQLGDVGSFFRRDAQREPRRAFERGHVLAVRGADGLASVVLGVAGVAPGGRLGQVAGDRGAGHVVVGDEGRRGHAGFLVTTKNAHSVFMT